MRASLLLVVLLLPVVATQGPPPAAIRISEVVADPKTDWNQDGKVTPSDEFIELRSTGPSDIDLQGWTLLLNDTTPERWALTGILAAGAYRAFVNPPGEINNNGHIALLDPQGRSIDEVRFGMWTGNAANVPGGGNTGANDEALRLTDAGWTKGHATPDAPPNGPTQRHVPPFPTNRGQAYDAGGVLRSLRVDWSDADRTFARADLLLGTTRSPITATASAGRWAATANVTTPRSDFNYRWELIDSAGRAWPGPDVRVVTDHDPPTTPVLDVPRWINTTTVRLHVAAAEDVGVAGVTYALERLNGSAWIRIADWTTLTDFTATFQDVATYRALARDALGSASTGANATVRLDRDPPAAPSLATRGGYDTVHLDWRRPADASGVAAYDLRRTAGTSTKSWRLLADVESFDDRGFHLGDTLTYSLRAIDAAGNVGPWAAVNASYEGMDPRLRSFRIDHEVWGTSDLRIHLDFDRTMDAAMPRLLLVGPAGAEVLEGRWLANATTFLATVDGETDRAEGPVTLRMEAATDDRGRSTPVVEERTLTIDRTPPTLVAGWTDGWIGADGLNLVAADANQPRVRYRLDDDAWSAANASVLLHPADGARVRAVATDAAGQRSKEIDRLVHLDTAAPTLRTFSWKRDRLTLDIADEASGVEAVNAVDASGRTIGTGTSVDLTDVDAVDVVAVDRVGNAGRWHLARPEVSTAPAIAKPKSAEVAHGVEAPSPSLLGGAVPVTAATGGVGIAALGILGIVRRQGPQRSLATRVRAAQARDSTRS